MKINSVNKRKIFNDPIYGFITLPGELIFDLIEHPYFQRLRRIKQLGLTALVYPGALHTRFHHAMGAMYLMTQAIEVLRSKGVEITAAEAEGVTAAVLLHDIGHGPFSHALESSLVHGVSHEKISELFMDKLNHEFNGALNLAITIFKNEYPKKFLHQLVSSQLDMDRLDYLKRDSFFTGVSEGIISSDRILAMLTVVNDSLAIEAKGIYSIEKFIIARRLMYWQVYLHKTVLSAEHLLVNILSRAKELTAKGHQLFATPALQLLLQNNYTLQDFIKNDKVLDAFAELDDNDIYTSIKVWMSNNDRILSFLCRCLMNRNLFKVELQNENFSSEKISELKNKARKKYDLSDDEIHYFVFTDSIKNSAYNPSSERISIVYKDGTTVDIADAADQLNISVLSQAVEKFFICYPKNLD